MTEIHEIKITDDYCRIKISNDQDEITIKRTELIGKRFADAVTAVCLIAAKTINHDADMMSVRQISFTRDKQDRQFVKVSGVLAAITSDPFAKPGKFTSPKIEATLFNNGELREIKEAAQEYVK
jgi:hypothetical protein